MISPLSLKHSENHKTVEYEDDIKAVLSVLDVVTK